MSLASTPLASGTATRSQAEPRVTIVVLNWNGREDTLDCLRSVCSIAYDNFGVIVVDNGSMDDSVASIRAAFPSVEVIETGENLGYAGGNNVGIRRALELRADYVLLLNNDTVVDRGILHAFVAAAALHRGAGAFGAKIYFHSQPNRIWYAGARWKPEVAGFTHEGWGREETEHEFSEMRETDYASGCALFAPAAAFREVGLLDEQFFLMFEETDWCFRAKKAGKPSIFVPDARLWHKVSASVGGYDRPLARYFLTRNGLRWARRHLGSSGYRDFLARRLYQIRGEVLPRFVVEAGQSWYLSRLLRAAYRYCMILRRQVADPGVWADVIGIRDHFLRRYGNCPASVRRLGKARS